MGPLGGYGLWEGEGGGSAVVGREGREEGATVLPERTFLPSPLFREIVASALPPSPRLRSTTAPGGSLGAGAGIQRVVLRQRGRPAAACYPGKLDLCTLRVDLTHARTHTRNTNTKRGFLIGDRYPFSSLQLLI